jgi:uncharacterized protein (DUF305 family)
MFNFVLNVEENLMIYVRFAAMIVVSTIVMFGLMYLNTHTADHVYFSQMRGWMALVMGAAMALIMISFMQKMYKNRRANIAIVVTAIFIFVGALFFVRSQTTVNDVAWMKAMIPHHSIAVLTRRRADFRDPRVRQLANEIIGAQIREIAEMKRLIAELEAEPVPANASELPPA